MSIEKPKEVKIEYSKDTGPALAGYTGAVSYTPQDALADGSFDAVPPSKSIVCLQGCKHYAVFCHEEPTSDPYEWQVIRRVCTYFHDDNGEMDMTDETIFSCSKFKPRFWSIKGWRAWIQNKKRIQEAESVIFEQKEKKKDVRNESTKSNESIECESGGAGSCACR
jgi:hypothetical protein